MTPIDELKIEIDTLSNLVGRLTGEEAGVWIDPHKAQAIAVHIMAAGYRTSRPIKLPEMETAVAADES